METKWEGYFEKEYPFKMTLEELHERAEKHDGHIFEEDLVAYIRHRGRNFTCLAPATLDFTHFMGITLGGDREGLVPCKLYWDEMDIYNPILDKPDSFDAKRGHWYHAHKIKYTPIEFKGCVETWYVSDFVQALNKGHIVLQEIEDTTDMTFEEGIVI